MCLSSYQKRWTMDREIFRNSRKCVQTWTFENCSCSRKRLGVPPNSPLEVFLIGEPNTNKNNHQLITHSAFWREKQGCFFGSIFVRVQIFDPTLVQYFIQTHHIFFCSFSKWFEQKIITFSGKVFSSELPRPRRHDGTNGKLSTKISQKSVRRQIGFDVHVRVKTLIVMMFFSFNRFQISQAVFCKTDATERKTRTRQNLV